MIGDEVRFQLEMSLETEMAFEMLLDLYLEKALDL